MNHPDKIAYLTLAIALLLDQNGKCPLREALKLFPLTAHVRRLAEQFIEGREAAGPLGADDRPEPAEGTETSPPQESAKIDAACGSFDCSQDDMAPGVVSEIPLRKVELRCPGCGCHRIITLDRNQQEHLRVRGHLEMSCGYCEAPSLWEFSKDADEEPTEVLV
jgi:hypothetical protein